LFNNFRLSKSLISPKVLPKATELPGLRFEDRVEHQVLRGQKLFVVGLRVLILSERHVALTQRGLRRLWVEFFFVVKEFDELWRNWWKLKRFTRMLVLSKLIGTSTSTFFPFFSFIHHPDVGGCGNA
jgi:hypothetical protein